MKKTSTSTVDTPVFGNRHYTDVTDVELFNDANSTYAAFYGLRFYKNLCLTDESGNEVFLIDIIDDKEAYYSAGKLMKHLNSANQIVIDKGVSRSHWKYATKKKELKEICGIKSNDTWTRVIKLLIDNDIIAKATVNDRTCFVFNPLYNFHSTSPGMPLALINVFWPTIKKQIKSTAIKDELEYCLSEWNNPRNANKPANRVEAEQILNGDLTEEIESLAKDDVFTEYVLDGQDPVIWHEEKWISNNKECAGYFVGKADENEFFTPNIVRLEDKRGKGRKAANVTHIRNLYIDIDAGKDSQGNYLCMDEVAKRKEAMRKVIAALPLPTMIIETRNGFHTYWSIDKADQKQIEQGKSLLKKIVRIVNIADKAASDISRLLRLPGSIHHKKGLEPFDVQIAEANRVRYTFDEIEAYLDENIASIEAACAEYNAIYPLEAHTKESKARTGKVINMPTLPVYFDMGANDSISICHSINMRAFLADMGYDAYGTKFKCVLPLHDDETGDAVIYDRNEMGQDYDVYVCHCSECSEQGLDIIGLVEAMYGLSFKEAVSFLLEYIDNKNIKTA